MSINSSFGNTDVLNILKFKRISGSRYMRILLISDIHWENPTININGKIIEQENILENLKNKVSNIKPSLVLFAGDTICDGSCSYTHVGKFLDLLKFLNKEKIYAFFIKGNHDYERDNGVGYERLLKKIKNLPYVKEISNKIVEFNKIKILGIPFSFTHKLNNLRKINETFPEQVDIILAHSEYVRRIWLFDLKSKFIITGHFDEQLCQILDKVLIALGGFPYSYAIIDYETNEQTITYFRERPTYLFPSIFKLGNEAHVSIAKLINGILVWETDESLKDSGYISKAENLILAKKKTANADINKQIEIIEDLLRIGVLKRQIEEYIGIKRDILKNISAERITLQL